MKVLSAKFLAEDMTLVTDEGSFWSDTKYPLLLLGVAMLHPLEHTPERPGAVLAPYPAKAAGPDGLCRFDSGCADPVVVCLARRYFDWANDLRPDVPKEIPTKEEALAEIQSGKNGWPAPDKSIRVIGRQQ